MAIGRDLFMMNIDKTECSPCGTDCKFTLIVVVSDCDKPCWQSPLLIVDQYSCRLDYDRHKRVTHHTDTSSCSVLNSSLEWFEIQTYARDFRSKWSNEVLRIQDSYERSWKETRENGTISQFCGLFHRSWTFLAVLYRSSILLGS